MRRPFLSALAALAAVTALAVPATDAAAQRRGRPVAAAQDWTRVAVRTPEGGFRIGNPNARIKLVEYLSTTCGNCAAFARESAARLIPVYVRSGRVSVEYRNYYLNGLDVAAAMLSRCATPASYFAMTHELLATQATWTARIRTVPAARQQQLQAMQPLQLIQELVGVLGLDAIGAAPRHHPGGPPAMPDPGQSRPARAAPRAGRERRRAGHAHLLHQRREAEREQLGGARAAAPVRRRLRGKSRNR